MVGPRPDSQNKGQQRYLPNLGFGLSKNCHWIGKKWWTMMIIPYNPCDSASRQSHVPSLGRHRGASCLGCWCPPTALPAEPSSPPVWMDDPLSWSIMENKDLGQIGWQDFSHLLMESYLKQNSRLASGRPLPKVLEKCQKLSDTFPMFWHKWSRISLVIHVSGRRPLPKFLVAKTFTKNTIHGMILRKFWKLCFSTSLTSSIYLTI